MLMLQIIIQMQQCKIIMNLVHHYVLMKAVKQSQQRWDAYGKMAHHQGGGMDGGTAKADKYVVLLR